MTFFVIEKKLKLEKLPLVLSVFFNRNKINLDNILKKEEFWHFFKLLFKELIKYFF